jgi:hypothetical protein
LRPGGWVEFQEFGGIIRCDDGSIPADSKVAQFFRMITESLGKKGMDWIIANFMHDYLHRAGFVNIQYKKIKCPVGIWPKVNSLSTSLPGPGTNYI